jgi:hypothetical protein
MEWVLLTANTAGKLVPAAFAGGFVFQSKLVFQSTEPIDYKKRIKKLCIKKNN